MKVSKLKKLQGVGCFLALLCLLCIALLVFGFLLSVLTIGTDCQIGHYPETLTDLIFAIPVRVIRLFTCLSPDSQKDQQVIEDTPQVGSNLSIEVPQYQSTDKWLVIGIAFLFLLFPFFHPVNLASWFILFNGVKNIQQEEDRKALLPPPIRTVLAEKLTSCFNVEELKTLCFHLCVRYDELGGDTQPVRVIELIGYCERRGRIQELIERARQDRPHISWP